MTAPHADWLNQLTDFREQGMRITDINPISALSDVICDQLYTGMLCRADLQASLTDMGATLWQQQCQRLRNQTGITDHPTDSAIDLANIDLDQTDITAPIYRAVFTAHPVFALTQDASMALCAAAESDTDIIPETPMPRGPG